jgi:alpha-beta hydrolase superfamily lysophospholipase
MATPTSAAQYRDEPVSVSIPPGSLSGSLMLPAGNGPFPVIIIIAGSGPTDRNGNAGAVLQTNAYTKLALGLAAQGIATLRYDKRGIGESTVNQSETQLRFDDYVDDALALCTWLEHDRRFSSISILGHSEGSLIGILAAQRDAHVRAVISLEGAGRSLASILNEQVRTNPANPPTVVSSIEHIDASLSAGKTVSETDPDYAALAAAAPQAAAGLFRPSVQPYLISEYAYDPAKEIAKLKIPVLIVHGTNDLQVSALDSKLLAAGDPRARLVTIESMNHILVDAPADRAGNYATYSQPDLPLAAALVPQIATFVRSATAADSSPETSRDTTADQRSAVYHPAERNR